MKRKPSAAATITMTDRRAVNLAYGVQGQGRGDGVRNLKGSISKSSLVSRKTRRRKSVAPTGTLDSHRTIIRDASGQLVELINKQSNY